MLTGPPPDTFVAFAEDYYGESLATGAVRHVFALRPLTAEVVAELNPEATLVGLAKDVAAIGYP